MTSWLYKKLGLVLDWEDFVANAKVHNRGVRIYTHDDRDPKVFDVVAFAGRRRFLLMNGEYFVDGATTRALVEYADSVAKQLRTQGLEVSVNDVPLSIRVRRPSGGWIPSLN